MMTAMAGAVSPFVEIRSPNVGDDVDSNNEGSVNAADHALEDDKLGPEIDDNGDDKVSLDHFKV